MKYSMNKPPCYEQCHKQFGAEWDNGLIIAYGDTIHCAHIPVSPQKEAHEQTHIDQQAGKPKEWWERYFADRDFRLSQEVEAYQNEIKFVKKYCKDRNQIARIVHRLCNDLARMYDCVDFAEASKILQSQ